MRSNLYNEKGLCIISDLQNTHKLELNIVSIVDGCIVLDDNTGAETTQVCGTETVYIASTNVTVTKESDNVAFTLNVTAISNEDLGIHSNISLSYVTLSSEYGLFHFAINEY